MAEKEINMIQYMVALILFHIDTIMGTSSTELKHLGCWILEQDNVPAIPSLEDMGNEHLTDNYWERSDPVTACAKAASSLGYNVFAVSNRGYREGSGECFASCSAAKTFANYGDRNAVCSRSGTGGWRSMNVYSLDVTIYLGCIKNKMSGYVIPDLEATHNALFGQPHRRKHSIEKCGAIARSRGYNVFGITKGGRCLASGDAYKLFTEHSNLVGPGKDCLEEKGSEHSISVHLTTGLVEYKTETSSNSHRRNPNRARRRDP
ncbi:hypothetical protein ACHWQZ_G001921 [Mnemiopsis leidyi]